MINIRDLILSINSKIDMILLSFVSVKRHIREMWFYFFVNQITEKKDIKIILTIN